MKVLILNAGVGSRMNMSRPKCLLKLARGETILSRQVRQLRDQGLKDITIAISNQKEKDFIEYASKVLLLVTYIPVINRGYECLASLMQVKEYLSYPLLIIHGDVIMSNDTMKEILSESYDDMMFIGDDGDIYCVLVEDGELIKNFSLPFKYDWENITRYTGKLWDMYYYFKRKLYIPKNYITDVDYEWEYKQVKKYMVEHKI